MVIFPLEIPCRKKQRIKTKDTGAIFGKMSIVSVKVLYIKDNLIEL